METRALRELRACVERVNATGDVRQTLSDEMHAHLTEAWREFDDEPGDAAMVLGGFFFYRWRAADERTDLLCAVVALGPCLLYGDMALPPDLGELVADHVVCEAELLRREARDSGDATLAARAGRAWARIVEATPRDDPRFLDRRIALARAAGKVRALQGDTAQSDQRIIEARRALVPPDHPDRLNTVLRLHLAFGERYEATGDVGDHEAALECAEELAAAHPDDQMMFLLGEKLHQRFLRTLDPSDLHRAVGLLRRSAAPSGPEQPERLLVLARALKGWWPILQERDVLDLAIQTAEDAESIVDARHEHYPEILWTLAEGYAQRHLLTRAEGDLDRALAAATQAQLRVRRQARFNLLLCDLYLEAYRHGGKSQDLFRALAVAENAARGVSRDHPAKPDALYRLGQALRERYERTGSVGDLDRAVLDGRAAIELLAPDDSRRSKYLTGLGNTYSTRFRLRGEGDALPAAIDLYRRAAATPPDSCAPVVELGRTLRWRYESTGDMADLDEAIALAESRLERVSVHDLPSLLLDLGVARRLRSAATGDPAELARAGAAVAEALALPDVAPRTQMRLRLEQAETAPNPADRLAAFEAVIDLLPRVGLRSPYEDDRQFMLSVHAGLGARAAEAAVAVGRPEHALALLELSRGILTDPPGNLRVPAADLCRRAARGPIVTLSTTENGGLALMVTPAGVTTLPLPDLTLTEAVTRQKALREAAAAHAHRDIADVLAWLWRAACRPVLDALAATGWDGARLWWCPAGVLTLLPLHAAGDGHDSVMARTVSSYLPTARAMPHAPASSTAPRGRALVVAMTNTPGEARLRAAASEASTLTRLLGATVLENDRATRRSVLAALPDARIVHFACHAHADVREPARSRLLLQDGALTPLDLLPLRLGGDLAYLSACSTGDVLYVGADEPRHITAAFHQIGFAHVVGTLWPVDDNAAADITDDFYERIAAHGPGDAARALHDAVLRFRATHPDQPALWAAHLHVGA
ncbi:CHAT domain-containing protein [Actinomadura algeriensis]|uniref:CHAT domain-containing protein n=1 Tax=Actinomadura algeriensis TaxID=1679523 RepID=A0ABR9JYQ0_9ACTN|nr:CHAT domain-containing protein [Actinomadura algeriensis]MBE1535588.1 hypothetical protein [Actinomadura algeriensis]